MCTVAGRSAVPVYPQLGQTGVFRRTRGLSVALSPNSTVDQPHPRDRSAPDVCVPRPCGTCGALARATGGPVGAAVWLGPAAWEVTLERAKAAGLDKLPTVLGAAAAERFLSVLAAIDPCHHREVPPAHWYVMVVGVAPEAQGTGIGQAFLRPMIDIVAVFSNGGFDWDSREAARTARSIRGSIMKTAICCLILATISASGLQAGTAPGLDAVQVASGLTQPLFVTAPPGDFSRLFIVQQDGNIRILNLLTSTLNPAPFLTLTGLTDTGGEQGLLGMAFDPNYATNGKFYLDFTVPGGAFGNGVTHVSQFSVRGNPDIADPNSERILITFDHPESNHNGGWIGFSPRTGDANNLYIATGDGGAGNDQGTGHIEPGGNAQNLTTLLGKMLRIHVDSAAGTATIPSNNPFVGMSGARGEIWAFGLRNPFRNSFDRQTGRMFIGDVGQDTREEIEAQQATNAGGGENYGWRVREGSIQNPAFPGSPTPPGQSIRYLIIRIRSVKQSLEVMFIAETEFRICVGSMFLEITARGKYSPLIMTGVPFELPDDYLAAVSDKRRRLYAQPPLLVRRGCEWRALYYRHRQRQRFQNRVFSRLERGGCG